MPISRLLAVIIPHPEKNASKKLQPTNLRAALARNPVLQYKNQVITAILTSRQNCATLDLGIRDMGVKPPKLDRPLGWNNRFGGALWM